LKSRVDVIYTDFNKAFDWVNHNALVQVLNVSGIGEPLLPWFSSYLSYRYQWIKLCIVISISIFLHPAFLKEVTYPFLFGLFINSVSCVLSNSRILCFTDDIKLYSRISSLDACILLQSDFDRFTMWFNLLGLFLSYRYIMSDLLLSNVHIV